MAHGRDRTFAGGVGTLGILGGGAFPDVKLGFFGSGPRFEPDPFRPNGKSPTAAPCRPWRRIREFFFFKKCSHMCCIVSMRVSISATSVWPAATPFPVRNFHCAIV